VVRVIWQETASLSYIYGLVVFARLRQCAPPSNTWFLGPTQVLNPNGISVGSAIIAGLTTVTDRQTDRQTDRTTDHATRSATIGRIYVRSTAIRRNKSSHAWAQISSVVIESKYSSRSFVVTQALIFSRYLNYSVCKMKQFFYFLVTQRRTMGFTGFKLLRITKSAVNRVWPSYSDYLLIAQLPSEHLSVTVAII